MEIFKCNLLPIKALSRPICLHVAQGALCHIFPFSFNRWCSIFGLCRLYNLDYFLTSNFYPLTTYTHPSLLTKKCKAKHSNSVIAALRRQRHFSSYRCSCVYVSLFLSPIKFFIRETGAGAGALCKGERMEKGDWKHPITGKPMIQVTNVSPFQVLLRKFIPMNH